MGDGFPRANVRQIPNMAQKFDTLPCHSIAAGSEKAQVVAPREGTQCPDESGAISVGRSLSRHDHHGFAGTHHSAVTHLKAVNPTASQYPISLIKDTGLARGYGQLRLIKLDRRGTVNAGNDCCGRGAMS